MSTYHTYNIAKTNNVYFSGLTAIQLFNVNHKFIQNIHYMSSKIVKYLNCVTSCEAIEQHIHLHIHINI